MAAEVFIHDTYFIIHPALLIIGAVLVALVGVPLFWIVGTVVLAWLRRRFR